MTMKHAALLACLLFLSACAAPAKPPAPPPVADAATTRTISGGTLVGFTDAATGANVWRAIPYAAPPVGALRWRAPRPPRAWSGTRPAIAPAPWCPQQLSAEDFVSPKRFGEVVGQEDCLYLNVYAPPMSAAQAAGAKLPVMMWIHGGSNTWGRAAQYDGGALAARFHVVVVVIQYRLGALGWFAHPAVRDGGTIPDDASPNFGTLDAIRALEWIKTDIAPFGGDPSRVTIFGESAGGQNVDALLTSPRAKGLFQRAIAESGSTASVPLAKAEGLEGGDPDAGRAVAPRIVGAGKPVTGETLRAAPLQAIFDAYTNKKDYHPPRVIADGIVLPAGGSDTVLGDPAAYNAVPVIVGTNRDEMKLFNALNPQLVNFLFGRLPIIRDPKFYEAASRYPSRMWRARAVDRPAAMMTGGGHSAVWTYRFDWDEEGGLLGADLGKLLGAAHSVEIPFVFGYFKLLGAYDAVAFTKANAPGRLALSDAMMSYWARFAATGDPGRGVDGRLPLWSAWSNTPGAPTQMVFATPKGGGVRMWSDRESGPRIVADLLADPTLNPRQRCQILGRILPDHPELQAAAAPARCYTAP
jgi:para-nitrobenzyl esterase